LQRDVGDISRLEEVTSDPAGADVYLNSYTANVEWQHVCRTPCTMRIPIGVLRWRVIKGVGVEKVTEISRCDLAKAC
jgi:hypothetical protein